MAVSISDRWVMGVGGMSLMSIASSRRVVADRVLVLVLTVNKKI
jgi:hypothetical protein